jgi:electron transfer flavoprotein alpha subunit
MDESGGSQTHAEVVTVGRQLSDHYHSQLSVLTIGHGIRDEAVGLFKYGADNISVTDSSSLKGFNDEIILKTILPIIVHESPAIILLKASSQENAFAATLAAAIGAPIISNVVELSFEDHCINISKQMYSGRYLARFSISQLTPHVLTILPRTISNKPERKIRTNVVQNIEVSFPPCALVKNIVEIKEHTTTLTDLNDAEIIVCGGRGLKSANNFCIIEELAEEIGATVGASRAVVDAGWRPQYEQIGQTGRTASPELYIACGVSGTIQHMAGIRTSKIIVAINNDANASIFKYADYGLIGDLHSIVPALTEEIKKNSNKH